MIGKDTNAITKREAQGLSTFVNRQNTSYHLLFPRHIFAVIQPRLFKKDYLLVNILPIIIPIIINKSKIDNDKV
jgi:hypothetical protein